MAVLGLGLTACLPDTSATPPSDQTQLSMYTAVNHDRTTHGGTSLTWSPKLADLASRWAAAMAAYNTLAHQNLAQLITTPDYAAYHTMGENILVGPPGTTPAQMEAAWWASTPHRTNIMNSAFNIVGVGYFIGSDGRVWGVQEFGGI
jgi:uncharacterized protein YkwD